MSPEEELREKIKELEAKLTGYEGEFQAVHTFLDAAGVMLPPGFDKMAPDEIQRKSTCAGRVAQFIIAKTGCPFKLARTAE